MRSIRQYRFNTFYCSERCEANGKSLTASETPKAYAGQKERGITNAKQLVQ